MSNDVLAWLRRHDREIEKLKTFEIPPSGMFWRKSGIAGTKLVVLEKIESVCAVLFAVRVDGNLGFNGGSTYVYLGNSTPIYDDPPFDILTLACSAGGQVTLQRTAGTATYTASLWMVAI